MRCLSKPASGRGQQQRVWQLLVGPGSCVSRRATIDGIGAGKGFLTLLGMVQTQTFSANLSEAAAFLLVAPGTGNELVQCGDGGLTIH